LVVDRCRVERSEAAPGVSKDLVIRDGSWRAVRIRTLRVRGFAMTGLIVDSSGRRIFGWTTATSSLAIVSWQHQTPLGHRSSWLTLPSILYQLTQLRRVARNHRASTARNAVASIPGSIAVWLTE
jgi:hypothetical protein